MAITRVQSKITHSGTGSYADHQDITLDSTPQEGNALLMSITTGSLGGPRRSVSSITQTGATWNKLIDHPNDSAYYLHTEIWAAFGVSGASASLTMSLDGAVDYNGGVATVVCEYPELSGVVDQTASYDDDGSWSTLSATGTTSTTTEDNELWFGVVAHWNASGAGLYSPTNGFTLIDGTFFGWAYGACTLEKIVSAAGVASSGAYAEWNGHNTGCIVTLKSLARQVIKINWVDIYSVE